MPVQLHNPAAPASTDHLPRDFRREIELVIRDVHTGEIISRTGLLVSSVESGDLTRGDHFDSYFEFAFVPAEGVEPPEGCYWSETCGDWARELQSSSQRKGGAA